MKVMTVVVVVWQQQQHQSEHKSNVHTPLQHYLGTI
jgi:hypothetical protein